MFVLFGRDSLIQRDNADIKHCIHESCLFKIIILYFQYCLMLLHIFLFVKITVLILDSVK